MVIEIVSPTIIQISFQKTEIILTAMIIEKILCSNVFISAIIFRL